MGKSLTEDLSFNLEELQQRSFTRIWYVGFSLSANTILKWLGESPRQIEGAIAVSPPVDLVESSRAIDLPRHFIYRSYYLRKLRDIMNQKTKAFPNVFSQFEKPQAYHSLWNFDDFITAPYFGFKNADAYLTQSSAKNVLHSIKNKVKIIHAQDDPFIPMTQLRWVADKISKNVELHTPLFGGHVGFYDPVVKKSKLATWVSDFLKL